MKRIVLAIATAVVLAVTGCTIDDQTIDNRPQFDREGNPNFDTQGNYQGCNGVGCEVDTPDDNSSDDDESD